MRSVVSVINGLKYASTAGRLPDLASAMTRLMLSRVLATHSSVMAARRSIVTAAAMSALAPFRLSRATPVRATSSRITLPKPSPSRWAILS